MPGNLPRLAAQFRTPRCQYRPKLTSLARLVGRITGPPLVGADERARVGEAEQGRDPVDRLRRVAQVLVREHALHARFDLAERGTLFREAAMQAADARV